MLISLCQQSRNLLQIWSNDGIPRPGRETKPPCICPNVIRANHAWYLHILYMRQQLGTGPIQGEYLIWLPERQLEGFGVKCTISDLQTAPTTKQSSDSPNQDPRKIERVCNTWYEFNGCCGVITCGHALNYTFHNHICGFRFSA